MDGPSIQALNQGVVLLGECLREFPLAARAAEIGIVRVGTPLQVFQEFTPADCFSPPEMQASGDTPLAQGILLGLKLIRERLQRYESSDLDSFKPWILIVSDGGTTDYDYIPEATAAIHKAEKQGMVSVFGVGVNASACRQLQQFCLRPAEELGNFDFAKLFRWVSRHIVRVSQSMPGEEPDGPNIFDADWRNI